MALYYLSERDIMTVLAATGQDVQVRDVGLLAAAAARPSTSAFGEDAYPDPWIKAAALLHSLTRNHPFVDGNKRAGWNAAWTFLEINEIATLASDFDVDGAEHLVVGIAAGEIEELAEIATGLRQFAE